MKEKNIPLRAQSSLAMLHEHMSYYWGVVEADLNEYSRHRNSVRAKAWLESAQHKAELKRFFHQERLSRMVNIAAKKHFHFGWLDELSKKLELKAMDAYFGAYKGMLPISVLSRQMHLNEKPVAAYVRRLSLNNIADIMDLAAKKATRRQAHMPQVQPRSQDPTNRAGEAEPSYVLAHLNFG